MSGSRAKALRRAAREVCGVHLDEQRFIYRWLKAEFKGARRSWRNRVVR